MFFMLLLTILFLAMASYKAHRVEWLIIATVTVLVFINLHLFDSNDPRLYWNRAAITFLGASALCVRCSFIGYYHAVVFVLTLCAYGALAYDVSQGAHILIYNHYEAVIYGLVGCQLIGIFPTIWSDYRDWHSSYRAGMADLFGDKKA